MASLILSGLAVVIFVVAVRGQACNDLDTTACHLLDKSNPGFCATSPLAGTACKRFCGNCPLTCYDCSHPILDPKQCTNTSHCPANQTCLINTYTDRHDGHHEYIMKCGDKTYCDGGGFGFGVGRRDVQQRDISIKCCHDDLCNTPSFTTTTQAMTRTPPPTPPPIHSCHSDIIFMLDESISIGEAAFNQEVEFVKSIVSSLDIGIHGDQVGLLVYDNQPHLQWNLNEYTTKAELFNALSYVPFHDGVTRTDLALTFVRENMLLFQNGDRLSAKNVIIVITDGRSTDHPDTVIEARKLHTSNNMLIALGVGITSDQELKDLATDDSHALKVASYHSLPSAVSYILSLIC